MTVSDEGKRSFYEKEAVNSGWSVRELKRQIESSLYERLLLSSADAKDIFLKKTVRCNILRTFACYTICKKAKEVRI